jgi:hypothetical protein
MFVFPSRRRSRPVLAALAAAAALLAIAPSAWAAPRNDDFGDAARLRVGQTIAGNVNGATAQRGEPRHANSLARRSAWYKLSASRRTTVLLSTCRTNFDTVIAVYTGRSLRGLRVVEYNNNGCRGNSGSRVSFTARPGRTYRIAVAGFTARGSFRLSATRISVPPNDDFVDAVAMRLGDAVSGTTRNATRELSEPEHQFNGSHTVWFRFTVAAPTVVEVSTCNASPTVYTGSSVRSLTRVQPISGGGCTEQFAAQPGTTYRIVAESGGSGGSYRFSTRAVTP